MKANHALSALLLAASIASPASAQQGALPQRGPLAAPVKLPSAVTGNFQTPLAGTQSGVVRNVERQQNDGSSDTPTIDSGLSNADLTPADDALLGGPEARPQPRDKFRNPD